MSNIYNLTQNDLNIWFSTLEQKVREVMQDGENLLGTLEFSLDTTKTIPAINRKTKDLSLNKWQMREDGILAIIHESLDIKPIFLLGSSALSICFEIELVQYDRTKTNSLAIMRLLSNSYFDVFKDPVTTPQVELPEGIAYERSLIEVNTTIQSLTKQVD